MGLGILVESGAVLSQLPRMTVFFLINCSFCLLRFCLHSNWSVLGCEKDYWAVAGGGEGT